MPTAYVVDASALAKAIVRETESDAFFAWLQGALAEGARLHAPALVCYELTEVVRKNRGVIDYPGDDPARALVREVVQGLVLDDDAWSRVDPWLGTLSAYDAAYLALAVAKGATLVTYDRKLGALAKDHVAVLSPGTTLS